MQLMQGFDLMLGQGADGGEIIYVIAVLILAAGSAIFEKLRGKMSESEKKPPARQAPTRRPRPSEPAGEPEPPVWTAPRPQQPRPAPPPARPKPVPPQRPRPTAPPAGIPEARRPQVPPRRKPVPAPRPVPQAVPAGAPAAPPVRSTDRVAAPAKDAAAARQDVASLLTRTVMSPGASVELRNLRPAELRQAIILSEVLGPPLALREEGTGTTTRPGF